MNNAEYFDGHEMRPSLMEAYKRLHLMCKYGSPWPGGHKIDVADVARFAQAPAMKCLAVLPGMPMEVMTGLDKGTFLTVTAYPSCITTRQCPSNIVTNLILHPKQAEEHCSLSLKSVNGQSFYCVVDEKVRIPRIPKEMWDYVRAQMPTPDVSKCPLKNPSCM